MKNIILERKTITSKYVAGEFQEENRTPLCDSLELPWLQNKQNISCIPGNRTYICKYNLEKNRFEILNVPDRTDVQIHIGNQLSEIKGCILVGTITDWKLPYISESKAGFYSLYHNIGKDEFNLTILDPTNITTFHPPLTEPVGDRRTWKEIGNPIVISPAQPQPAETKINVKMNWLQKLWVTDGLKRIAGIAGLIAGIVMKLTGTPGADELLTLSGGVTTIGFAHAAIKSEPAHGGKAGIVWTIIESFLDWLKMLINKLKR
ncbi:MAG: DUF5675 family protein [Smithella sp.]|nr:DUF5675 family protein [Smithella sp.]